MAYGELTYTHSDGYQAPFPETERCVARSTQSKLTCRKRRCTGLRVCQRHGGGTPASKEKRTRAEAMEAMRRFVTPIPGEDIEANPIVAFELEFRRTIAKIRYFDEVIAELAPDALGWGKSKETNVESSEYPGVDTEKLAQANIYYKMQLEERKRLVDLIKIWIGAKLDVRKLQIEEQKVEALNGVIVAVLSRLGHNVKDPALRAVVREEMLALPVAGTPGAEVIATARDILDSPKSLVTEAVKQAQRKVTP